MAQPEALLPRRAKTDRLRPTIEELGYHGYVR